MPATYLLQSLRGELCGFQVLMAFLKAAKDSSCFISRGTGSQIPGPKFEMVSVLPIFQKQPSICVLIKMYSENMQ